MTEQNAPTCQHCAEPLVRFAPNDPGYVAHTYSQCISFLASENRTFASRLASLEAVVKQMGPPYVESGDVLGPLTSSSQTKAGRETAERLQKAIDHAGEVLKRKWQSDAAPAPAEPATSEALLRRLCALVPSTMDALESDADVDQRRSAFEAIQDFFDDSEAQKYHPANAATPATQTAEPVRCDGVYLESHGYRCMFEAGNQQCNQDATRCYRVNQRRFQCCDKHRPAPESTPPPNHRTRHRIGYAAMDSRCWYCTAEAGEPCRDDRRNPPESTPDVPGPTGKPGPPVEYIDTICPDCHRSCATRQTRTGPQTGAGGVLCWKHIIDLEWAREDCQRAMAKEPVPPRPEGQGAVTNNGARQALQWATDYTVPVVDTEGGRQLRTAMLDYLRRYVDSNEARDKAQAERIAELEKSNRHMQAVAAAALVNQREAESLRAELAALKKFAETEYTRGYNLGKQSQTHAVAVNVETMVSWASRPGTRNVSIAVELAMALARVCASVSHEQPAPSRETPPGTAPAQMDGTGNRERAVALWGQVDAMTSHEDEIRAYEQALDAAEQRGRASRDGVVPAGAAEALREWRALDSGDRQDAIADVVSRVRVLRDSMAYTAQFRERYGRMTNALDIAARALASDAGKDGA